MPPEPARSLHRFSSSHVRNMFVIKDEKYLMNLLCTMWSISTELVVILHQHIYNQIFFFVCLQRLPPCFRASKHHSNKRQLERQPANTSIKNKARFLVSFSAGCDVSSLSGDVTVLCALYWCTFRTIQNL